MDTETATNPVEGADTSLDTGTSTQEVDTEGQTAEPELDDEGNPVEPAPEDDSEELDLDGLKFKVPKAAKDAFLRQADYTRKTQEVADLRKAFEAERQTLHQSSEAEIDALAQVRAIDQQLAYFQRVDWRTWNETDPFESQKGFMEFQQLKDARAQVAGQYSQLAQQRISQAQQETAKRIEEGRAVLAREIKGWGPELAEALLGTATKEYGFQRGEAEESISDPRLMKVLHDAHQWRAHQAKSQKAQNHVAAQAAEPAAKPSAARSGPPAGLDDRLSVDEWKRRREAQVRKRA